MTGELPLPGYGASRGGPRRRTAEPLGEGACRGEPPGRAAGATHRLRGAVPASQRLGLEGVQRPRSCRKVASQSTSKARGRPNRPIGPGRCLLGTEDGRGALHDGLRRGIVASQARRPGDVCLRRGARPRWRPAPAWRAPNASYRFWRFPSTRHRRDPAMIAPRIAPSVRPRRNFVVDVSLRPPLTRVVPGWVRARR